jgi:hypothetical protein
MEKKLSEWQVSRTSHTLRGFSDSKKGSFSQSKLITIFTSKPVNVTMNGISKNDILTRINHCMFKLAFDGKLCKQFQILKEKIERLTESDLPKIVSISKKKMTMSVSVIRISEDKLNLMIEIHMPCNFSENGFTCARKSCGNQEQGASHDKSPDNSHDKSPVGSGCKLQWMLWPDNIIKPSSDAGFQALPQYHDIKIMGKSLTQPRKTACIGKPYKFSGVEHPMSEDPSGIISELMDSTNKMFNLPADANCNMCLTNVYSCGRHAIGEHADDEKSMGHLKDVFCWCEGGARELIIRCRKGKTGESLRSDPKKDTPKSRELIRVSIPEGLYVMNGGEGGCFQKEYTHEFPEVHPALFKKMQTAFAENVVKYPKFPRDLILSDKGASRLHLVQAEYITRNPAEAKEVMSSFISSGKESKQKKQKTLNF